MNNHITECFTGYQNYVNATRALADYRDGLKSVQRRILYDMNENKLSCTKPHKKVAFTVGSVLGRYHPHGDSSIAGALIRLAQDFSLYLPLIDGHGNFGTLELEAGASRYIEARLSAIGNSFLDKLDKRWVEFAANYDNTLMEPVYLPARFPNLLINPSMGIGVGMASSIPSHNLTEVINALINLVDDKNYNPLLSIKGPDFGSGCFITNAKDFAEIYSQGRGSFRLRAQVNVNNRILTLTNLPYKVSAAKIEKQLLNNDDLMSMISKIQNLTTDQETLQIQVKPNVDTENFIELLYANTAAESTFNLNFNALDKEGKVKHFSLNSFLLEWLDYFVDLLTKEKEYELSDLKHQLDINEGLYKAALNIDEVIKVIRNAEDKVAATNGLLQMGFNIVQVEAILNIRLARLTKLEYLELEKKVNKLKEAILDIVGLLENSTKFDEYTKQELSHCLKFSKPRCSAISHIDKVKINKNKQNFVWVKQQGPNVVVSSENSGGQSLQASSKNPVYVLGNNQSVPVTNDKVGLFPNSVIYQGGDLFVVKDNYIKRLGPSEVMGTRALKMEFDKIVDKNYQFLVSSKKMVADDLGYSKRLNKGTKFSK